MKTVFQINILTEYRIFFFTAGVDTTRLTLEWFLCFISGLPEIQAKCQAEIDQTIGILSPFMTWYHIKICSYTDQVLYSKLEN